MYCRWIAGEADDNQKLLWSVISGPLQYYEMLRVGLRYNVSYLYNYALSSCVMCTL